MILDKIKLFWAYSSSERYIKWLRKRGIIIGENCVFRFPRHTLIDLSRPCLIEIGNEVDMNKNFQILTHDYATRVFINKYGEFINSSGKVEIGNNIYFGVNVTVLKGVSIGDNCIIGAGSIVNKSIPANSVAAGNPCKVICTIDDFFVRRKQCCVKEGLEYARCIVERYHRRPVVSDFWEEFPLFTDVENVDPEIKKMIIRQLSTRGGEWLKTHKKTFDNIDDFLKQAGV